MKEIELAAQIRDHFGTRKLKSIRRQDFVPGIVYGGKEKKSTSVQIDRRAYERIMRQHHGQNVIFHLNVMEGDKKLRDYSAIVREEQHEPVSFRLVHLDFQSISLTEEIEVKVRIEAKGDPIGVKQDGGSLDQPLWELDVICLPTNIPDKIEIEVSHLKIGDAVHVKDIKLPAGVKTKHDAEAMVVSVVPPMKEETAAPVEGQEALTEPEVLKEKKPKEGEAVEGAAKTEKKEEKPDQKKDQKKE